MEKDNYLTVMDKSCKIIDVKDTNQKTNVVVGLTLIYYFLCVSFVISLFLTNYFLIKQKYMYVLFSGSMLLLILVALGREKQVLFLKVSYPRDGIIRINSYDLDYKKNDVKIYLVAIQKGMHQYDYKLNISNDDDLIYSAPINYVRQKKILKFIDNLIFDENL